MYKEISSKSNLFFKDVYFYFMSKLCVVICIKGQSYFQVYWNCILLIGVSLVEIVGSVYWNGTSTRSVIKNVQSTCTSTSHIHHVPCTSVNEVCYQVLYISLCTCMVKNSYIDQINNNKITVDGMIYTFFSNCLWKSKSPELVSNSPAFLQNL
jgi:hypothetical protein